MMSEENVELYRRGIEAFNNRDLEAFLALADPDVVGVSRVLAIEGGSYRGHDGTREWWRDLSVSSLTSGSRSYGFATPGT